jgi:hypothetical protein
LDRPTEEFGSYAPIDGPFVERAERQMSVFRVGAFTANGRRELCIVRNVSAAGMMIKTYSVLVPGTRIAIELKQGELLDATVRWENQGAAGVEFDQPVDVDSLLCQDPDAPRPRMPRIDIDAPVFVREGAATRPARARDISQGGVRIECDAPLAVNADVVVTLGGMLPKAAVVRWTNGRSVGLGFNKVVPVNELVGWLHDLQHGGDKSNATG